MKKILVFIGIIFVLCLFTAFSFGGEKMIKVNVDGGTIYGELINCSKDVVVVIIAGSGPTDMNGNTPLVQGRNDSFLQLAKALEKQGISTFRYDKRSAGKSSETFDSTSQVYFDDFINDLNACVGKLKDMGYKKVILAGHSQGSLIGMTAAQNVEGFISIAGPGYPIAETMIRQYSVDEASYAKEINTLKMLSEGKVNEDLAKENQSFSISKQKFLLSWMKYDPREELAKLNVPVLLVHGAADLQVTDADLQELQKAYPNSQTIVIADMNHVLKKVSDTEENIKAYQDPSFAIHNQLIEAIVSFVLQVE